MTWFAVCDVDGCGLAVRWDDDEEMDTWRVDAHKHARQWSVMRDRHFCPDHVEAP